MPLDPSILTVEIDLKDQNLTHFIVKDQFKIWNRWGITQRLMIVPKFDAFSSSNIARVNMVSSWHSSQKYIYLRYPVYYMAPGFLNYWSWQLANSMWPVEDLVSQNVNLQGTKTWYMYQITKKILDVVRPPGQPFLRFWQEICDN